MVKVYNRKFIKEMCSCASIQKDTKHMYSHSSLVFMQYIHIAFTLLDCQSKWDYPIHLTSYKHIYTISDYDIRSAMLKIMQQSIKQDQNCTISCYDSTKLYSVYMCLVECQDL